MKASIKLNTKNSIYFPDFPNEKFEYHIIDIDSLKGWVIVEPSLKGFTCFRLNEIIFQYTHEEQEFNKLIDIYQIIT